MKRNQTSRLLILTSVALGIVILSGCTRSWNQTTSQSISQGSGGASSESRVVNGKLGVRIDPAPALPGDLAARQTNPDSTAGDWPLYGRNYNAWRYSPLTQINKANVTKLRPAWVFNTGTHNGFEGSAVVIDGTMYISTPWNHVFALDAATGKQYWSYAYEQHGHPLLCCDAVNRGVGVGSGKVVMATLDCHIVGLDSKTGKQLWDTTVDDVTKGYTMTLAPQIIGNKAIVGTSGGEYGIRGHIDAYDINTGKMIWRFYTIPGPGEPGNETWAGNSWKTGGGPQWMTVTYDPALKMVYAGIGNTAPDLDGTQRAGDNLYCNSVVALDVDTGKLRWYYQTVPHDVWDLDCTVCPVIDDITYNGQKRKVVMFAPKNGYFYAIDRTNGKPVYALQVARKVTWGKVTRDGIPHPDKSKYPNPDTYTEVAPGASGGKEWANECYNPKLKRMFIPISEEPFKHKMVAQKYIPGEYYWGGVSDMSPAVGHVVAVDAEKGKIAWDTDTANYPAICSISNTASGLVITGTADQRMVVLDANTGKNLWTYTAISGFHGNPVIYGVKGKEYICFPNGWGGPPQGGATAKLAGLPVENNIYVFTLP